MRLPPRARPRRSPEHAHLTHAPPRSILRSLAGAAVSPLRPDDVPKPELPDGCICPLCRVTLTEKELESLTVTIANGTTALKWRCYHAAGVCTTGQKSVSVPNFAIMLSQLSVFERHCVLISVANFAAAKKVISLRLAAEAAEIADDGPLDG